MLLMRTRALLLETKYKSLSSRNYRTAIFLLSALFNERIALLASMKGCFRIAGHSSRIIGQITERSRKPLAGAWLTGLVGKTE